MDLDATRTVIVLAALTAAFASVATSASAAGEEITAPFDAEVTSKIAEGLSTPSTITQVSGKEFRLTVILILTVLTIFGNGFAIYVINSKNQSLKSGRIWEVRLVSSLFSADLLLGLSAMPLAFISGVHPEIVEWSQFPKLQVFFLMQWGCCSVYNMAAISFIKKLAIARPFHFDREVTSRRCWAVIAVIWLFSFVLGVPVLTDFAHFHYSAAMFLSTAEEGNLALSATWAILVYIPATSIIFVSYWKIFRVVVKHKTQIAETSVLSDASYTQYRSVIAAIKSAKKIFVIIVLYFAVYTPAAILVISGDVEDPERQGRWHVFLISWITLGNSCYNSILYITMHSRIRNAARKLLLCQEGDLEDSPSVNVNSTSGNVTL